MVRCSAVRWAGDEPQPGLVEVALTDPHDHVRSMIDKVSVFDAAATLGPDADYPVDILVACHVLERRIGRDGQETAVIDLLPWGVSDETFEIAAERLEPSAG